MKRMLISMLLCLSLVLCFAACDGGKQPEQTTPEVTTEAPTTEEPTTEEPTTEEPTTEDPTTEELTTEEPKKPVASREEIKAAATAFIDAETMLEASNNPQQDWSDFGGLTVNEDGSVTALIEEDSVAVWDPYFYLIKQDTVVDDIMVIQYRSAMEYDLRLFLGTEGNAATGAGDLLTDVFYETGDEWGYLILDIGTLAGCYDASAQSLGYLRMGFGFIESGESVDIGYIAFFHTVEDVYELIPQ